MIVSEIINQAFGHILDEQYKLCATEEKEGVYTACQRLWLTLDSMSKITSCFRDGGEFASVAVLNEKIKAADYIKFKIGVDPILDETFAHW